MAFFSCCFVFFSQDAEGRAPGQKGKKERGSTCPSLTRVFTRFQSHLAVLFPSLQNGSFVTAVKGGKGTGQNAVRWHQPHSQVRQV